MTFSSFFRLMILIPAICAAGDFNISPSASIRMNTGKLVLDGSLFSQGTVQGTDGTISVGKDYLNTGTSAQQLTGPRLIFTGNLNQRLISSSTLKSLNISKSGGTVAYSGNLNINPGFLLISGGTLAESSISPGSLSVSGSTSISQTGNMIINSSQAAFNSAFSSAGNFSGGSGDNFFRNSLSNTGIFTSTSGITHLENQNFQWNQQGIFNHSTGKVKLYTGNYSFSGTTGFYDFEAVSLPVSIAFDSSQQNHQRFHGLLKIRGTDTDSAMVSSTVSGQQAQLDAAFMDLSHVSLKDLRNMLSLNQTPVYVISGQDLGNNQGFDFGSSAPAPLTGRVLLNGNGISNCNIRLFNSGKTAFLTSTSSDGSFTVSGISPGINTIWAFYPGYKPVQHWFFVRSTSEIYASPVLNINPADTLQISGNTYFTVSGQAYIDYDHDDTLEISAFPDLVEVKSLNSSRFYGAAQVAGNGSFQLMVYLDDPVTSGTVEGAVSGETILFTVNGIPAETMEVISAFSSVSLDLHAWNTSIQPYYLDSGWNLISFPLFLNSSEISQVFSTVMSQIIKITSFTTSPPDPGEEGGKSYINDPQWIILNDLKQIDPFHAYWVKCSSASFLILEGSRVNPLFPRILKKGWNYVGYWKKQKGYLPASYTDSGSVLGSVFTSRSLGFISSFYTALESSTPGARMFVNSENLFSLNDLLEMTPGKGYLFFMKENDVLTFTN